MLTHSLMSDVWYISHSLTMEFSAFLRGAAFFSGGVGFVIYTSPQLAVVSLFPMLFIGGWSRYYGEILKKERRTQA